MLTSTLAVLFIGYLIFKKSNQKKGTSVRKIPTEKFPIIGNCFYHLT